MEHLIDAYNDRMTSTRASIAVACAIAALALVVAGCAPVSEPQAAAPALAATAVAITNTITVDGVNRDYLLRTPATAVSEPRPLLLVVHGAGGNAGKAEKATGMTALSDAGGFIVAYPQGTQAADVAGEYSWNAGACCANPVKNNVDDVAYIKALIADIQTQQSVDPARIYIAGFSNGGMLAYRLACELPGEFAGIAVVSGAFNVSDCATAGATSVLMIHGTGDKTVPYSGGATNERTALRFGQWENASLAMAVDFWSNLDGCGTAAPFAVVEGGVTRKSFAACADEKKVDVVTIADGGHIWPIKAQSGFDASSLITEFFDLAQPSTVLAR